MSGELVTSQFRYTTTNNRDFVIGDPSDLNDLPKYLVFQVNATPGYNSNPHIKAEKVGSDWRISISEDGSTPLNFAYIDKANTFTGNNIFQAPVVFENSVNIQGTFSLDGTPLVLDSLAYLAASNDFTGYNSFSQETTFNNTVTVNGTKVQLDVTNVNTAAKTLLLNDGGLSSSALNAGIDIEGDGGAVIAYVRNTVNGMAIKSIDHQPISLIGDTAYPISISPITPLTKTGSYLLPPHTQNSAMLLTTEHSSGAYGFTSNSELLINTDRWHVAQSGITLNDLSTLFNGNTDRVSEGSSNLYFTEQRVLDTKLTGYALISGSIGASPVTAADSVIQSISKLQNQLFATPSGGTGTPIPTGSIHEFAGTVLPAGFLWCDGAEINRTAYAILFSIIGTTYGVGNGTTTFKLPDMRGRSVVGAGQGLTLTNRALGITGGEETHILTASELPAHRHSIVSGDSTGPGAHSRVTSSTEYSGHYTGYAGENAAHNNMQPFLALNYIIKYTETGLDAGGATGTATPPGMVMYFATQIPPEGWLEANGSAVSRLEYPFLFGAIGVTYGIGDGTTTFNLPDLRGEFIRGWDHGRGTADVGRVFGSVETDLVKAHTHRAKTLLNSASGTSGAASVRSDGAFTSDTDGIIETTGGTETRPRNVALLPCIKFDHSGARGPQGIQGPPGASANRTVYASGTVLDGAQIPLPTFAATVYQEARVALESEVTAIIVSIKDTTAITPSGATDVCLGLKCSYDSLSNRLVTAKLRMSASGLRPVPANYLLIATEI